MNNNTKSTEPKTPDHTELAKLLKKIKSELSTIEEITTKHKNNKSK